MTTQGNNESGLLQQVDLKRVVVSEQWSLKAGRLLIWVVFNTGLTVYRSVNR